MSSFEAPIRRRANGKGHSYQDSSGARVPGVTTIIGAGCPKPALIDWAARTTVDFTVDNWSELAELPVSERIKRMGRARFEQRDSAARRGTDVHRLGDRLAHGETVDVPDELAEHVAAYVSFLDAWDVQPILAETVVVSYAYGYAGTLDLVASLRHPTDPDRRVVWLLDLKTSASGLYREVALQLSAYRHATHYQDTDGVEQPMIGVERCGVVHVRADGAELVPVAAGLAEHRQFLYVQQVARFAATDVHELISEPLVPPLGAVA